MELTGTIFSALASQSLSVVSELIPYVRETFRRHLNQAEAVLLVDFDKLKRVRVFGSLSGLFPSVFPCYHDYGMTLVNVADDEFLDSRLTW